MKPVNGSTSDHCPSVTSPSTTGPSRPTPSACTAPSFGEEKPTPAGAKRLTPAAASAKANLLESPRRLRELASVVRIAARILRAAMRSPEPLPNFIGGRLVAPSGAETLPVLNPATGELLSRIPLSGAEEVGRAVAGAREAFAEWRETPPADRVQPLFRLKALLERDFEELSRSVTLECGKTLAEARGEVRRAIENVEVACGIPSLMQGRALEDIARGIDEFMLRQPVGVAAVIAPFNFPAMIPFWFLPYALACGNAVVVKPSRRPR